MPEPAIRVEGLRKRFGDVVALDGVDFEVPPATVFGLLGPNGAGKTTAVRVLTTILRPDAGNASVLGLDVVKDAERVRARIGLAGQFAAVDGNLTGRENLRLIGRLTHLPRRIIEDRAGELLDQFDLTDAADRPARTYSGGMRRRLDLCAALVHRPPVLFLDEPTTGLDLYSRNQLWAVIENLQAEGATLLLTTQYLEEADRLADDLVVIDHGEVIAAGSPVQLKSSIGGTVIEIGLDDPGEARRAQAFVANYAVRPPEVNGSEIRFEVADGARALVDVLRTLDGEGLVPTTIAVREPSLDDVFLALTGRRPEPEEAPEEETRGAA
ncbi:MAG: ATP-binding cassette domain-containing protein [Actinomycetota bacterium]|nr:ATP-binding cassette domain-containing protein [Actinomycetota bacterium]